jgi:hypothetical protein
MGHQERLRGVRTRPHPQFYRRGVPQQTLTTASTDAVKPPTRHGPAQPTIANPTGTRPGASPCIGAAPTDPPGNPLARVRYRNSAQHEPIPRAQVSNRGPGWRQRPRPVDHRQRTVRARSARGGAALRRRVVPLACGCRGRVDRWSASNSSTTFSPPAALIKPPSAVTVLAVAEALLPRSTGRPGPRT